MCVWIVVVCDGVFVDLVVVCDDLKILVVVGRVRRRRVARGGFVEIEIVRRVGVGVRKDF